MIIQYVKFKSALPEEEVYRLMVAREEQFRALPGLLQKYYYRDRQTGEYGGVYLWETEAAMQRFRESPLAQSMADTYRIEGEKRVEILDVKMILRSEGREAGEELEI